MTSADIRALDLGEGAALGKVSLGVLVATGRREAGWEACKGAHGAGPPEGGKTAVTSSNGGTSTATQIAVNIRYLIIFVVVLDFKMWNPDWPS